MTEKLQELKQAVYTKLKDLTRKAAPSGNNAGGQGNHGGNGQGSSTGQGHSEHGQGYGYGHTEIGTLPGTGAGGSITPVLVDSPGFSGGADHIGDYLAPMPSGAAGDGGIGGIMHKEVPTLDVAIRGQSFPAPAGQSPGQLTRCVS